jgi:hypothetical protein
MSDIIVIDNDIDAVIIISEEWAQGGTPSEAFAVIPEGSTILGGNAFTDRSGG